MGVSPRLSFAETRKSRRSGPFYGSFAIALESTCALQRKTVPSPSRAGIMAPSDLAGPPTVLDELRPVRFSRADRDRAVSPIFKDCQPLNAQYAAMHHRAGRFQRKIQRRVPKLPRIFIQGCQDAKGGGNIRPLCIPGLQDYIAL